ncbi:MAG: right-handed parallel beta-helix repeat-containing protein [Candidatus Zipacnadales bacterium]
MNCGLLVSTISMAGLTTAEPVTLYVAPNGNDLWSGQLAEVNANRTDGPLATVIGARDALRRLRAAGAATGSATVLLRGGVYWMPEPLVLEPRDSHITFAAYGEERPVLSGGQRINGWHRGPGGVWSAPVPKGWEFRQLFVNGQRRTRARSPNEGWFITAGKGPLLIDPATGEEHPQDAQAFVFTAGDLKAWENLNQVEVIVYHSWETSRHRIAEVDEANCVVRFTGRAHWPFERWGKGQRYYVENAPDALDAPGEWYLDPHASVVHYLPLPGEDMEQAEVIAPRLRRLVDLRGDPEVGLYVEDVTLRGLAFHHQDWELGPNGHSDPQAAVSVPAAVMADGTLGVNIERCEIAHVGEYAVWFRHGCKRNRFVHNRITDIGAGGVRIGEASMSPTEAGESSYNLIDNNHVFDLGHVYPAGVGIWVAQSSHNTISHNEIHDVNYSGLSIGWNWNDEENRCHHNLIEQNHVHHVMQGQLNDGGAIYTLGTSPGSVIRNNVFHDVWPYSAIGWGIYLDATTNQYLVEKNLVYNTLSGGLMYHNGGHQLVIRNNIFALSAHQALWPYFAQRPTVFEHNIIYFTQGELFIPFSSGSLQERQQAGESLGTWDYNIYWNPHDPNIRFHQRSFADWQALGLDEHSVIEDPQFLNVEAYDFRLKATSPALKLGFEPLDTSQVGLYGE